MSLKPVPMTKDELVDVLTDMLTRIREGDSFEGSIEYLIPESNELIAEGKLEVTASYRIGNRDGQGGMRMIGEIDGSESLSMFAVVEADARFEEQQVLSVYSSRALAQSEVTRWRRAIDQFHKETGSSGISDRGLEIVAVPLNQRVVPDEHHYLHTYLESET